MLLILRPHYIPTIPLLLGGGGPLRDTASRTDIYGYEGFEVLSTQVDFATLMQCHLIPEMHTISRR